MAVEIGLDELLAEYARLGLGKDDKGLTTSELATRWGIGEESVRSRLRIAHRKGVLRVGRKSASRIDGVPTIVPCYWIETPKQRKVKK